MFIYQEEGLPSQFYASPRGHHQTLSSTSIQREEIPDTQQAEKSTAENRSTFGGSQSASVTMSANMHRIMEGVERLVDSDTYEIPPPVSESPELIQVPSIPSGNPYGRSSEVVRAGQGLEAPAVPPGLGFRSVSTPSQSYKPRPAIPNIPSIWSTEPAVSPHSRPGSTRQMSPSVTSPNFLSGADQGFALQEPASSYAFQNALLNQKQQIQEAPSPWESSWTSPDPIAHYRDQFSSIPYQEAFPSSHDKAFIAPSSVPSGTPFFSSSDLKSGRPSSTRLGAIGQQTPPCGQKG
jgi:hypothetical protein